MMDMRIVRAVETVRRREAITRIVCWIVVFSVLTAMAWFVLCHWWCDYSHADERRTAYVVVTLANFREQPTTSSAVVYRGERGDEVDLTGVSRNGWLECYGSEWGTMWVRADLVSEQAESAEYTNISGGKVHIRKTAGGKICGSVKKGQTVTVTSVIDGWGYIGRGWVSMEFFGATR